MSVLLDVFRVVHTYGSSTSSKGKNFGRLLPFFFLFTFFLLRSNDFEPQKR